MFDGGIDMLSRDGVIDEAAHAVAPAQVLVGRFGIRTHALGHLALLVRTQFEAQPIHDVLHDRILHRDDVSGVRIDAIAPKDLTRPYLKQLRRYPNMLARAYERCR